MMNMLQRVCALFLVGGLGLAANPSYAFDFGNGGLDSITQSVNDAIKNLDLPAGDLQTLEDAIIIDPRMIGGRRVTIVDNPWQVALVRGIAAEPQRFQFCGGTLIASGWVLTAAHCVDNTIVNRDPTMLDVIVGTDFYPVGGERIDVNQIIIHPQWGPGQNFDFALLRLAMAAKSGSSVPMVAQNVSVQPGTLVRVTGWGAIVEGGRGSEDLLGADMPIVSNQVCNAVDSYNGRVTEAMLCAGLREGGVDSCQGDSGGPLTINLSGQRMLLGVVSWGEGCARRLKYGVYANVAIASDWIKAQLQN